MPPLFRWESEEVKWPAPATELGAGGLWPDAVSAPTGFSALTGTPGVWLKCRVWFRRICIVNHHLGNLGPRSGCHWVAPQLQVHCHFEVHGSRVLCSHHQSPLRPCNCEVRNTAWPGREPGAGLSGPHSQKRQEAHSETGRNKLSGPNWRGSVPQERRGSRTARSSGEVVRVLARVENTTRAQKCAHRSFSGIPLTQEPILLELVWAP